MPKRADITAYRFFRQLTELPFVEAIHLYGSRARGEHHPTSDIDLAIRCPEAGVKDWARVRDIIESADTLLEIDCVRLDTAAGNLREAVLNEGKILYEKLH